MRSVQISVYFMLYWLLQIFCRHEDPVFVRNLYGDEIIEHGWRRSMYRCSKCGAVVYAHELHHERGV